MSTRVVKRGRDGAGRLRGRAGQILKADGLMTDAGGFLLGIQVADCVPVLVADTRRQVVAAFHAGWRGTAAGIVEQGIAQMRVEFGSDPNDLVGAVGPSIRACCYRVGDEVRQAFACSVPVRGRAVFHARRGGVPGPCGGKPEADAGRGARSGCGDGAGRVYGMCDEDGERKYFSHRMEHGSTGRMMAAIQGSFVLR